MSAILAESSRQERETCNSYGNDFWKRDSCMAPIGSTLGHWGLATDDLDVVYFYGTLTVKHGLMYLL